MNFIPSAASELALSLPKWQALFTEAFSIQRSAFSIFGGGGVPAPHKAAALAYSGLGVLVIVITFAAGLIPAGRENPITELSIGAVFIILFAVLIYRGWWLISAVLVFSNSWRAFTYFNDGLGRHVELLPFSVTQIEPKPIAFVNAALMVVIVFMLARSAWAGFSIRFQEILARFKRFP